MADREKLYTTTDLAYWYGLGVRHERERVACALHELDLLWGRNGEQVHRDRHGELMRLFAVSAEALRRELYDGAVRSGGRRERA